MDARIPWPRNHDQGPIVTESVSQRLAQYAVSTTSDAIPEQVRERAKHVIMDEMASAYFGRSRVAGDLAARYASGFGGTTDALILGTRTRVPAPMAALANGTAGHADEVDGAHVVGGHPGASIVHGAVAMAERQRASGAELVNAVVLGYDVGTRIVQACGGKFVVKSRLKLHTDFFYALGVAAAASRLLGLDAARHCHALALVTFQTNGLIALYSERRHISKAFCNGQYAMAGVSSALMAGIGLEGHDDILGTSFGLLDAWGVEGGAEHVTRGLGQDYAIMGANFKFVNAGYPIHAVIEAAMKVMKENAIAPNAIAGVHVGMPGNAMRVVDDRPMHSICVQDMLTAALLRGGLTLRESPFPTVLSDPGFSPLRERITVAIDPDLERELPNGRGANVAITTRSGATFSHRVDWPRGHSRRSGVTFEDLAEKWHDAMPDANVDRMLALGRSLEELEDVRTLTDAFIA